MSADLKDVLLTTLAELGKSDFITFKKKLRDHTKQEKRKIAWSQLEEAEPYGTVDLIVQVYPSAAGDIVVAVLKKINQIELAESLEQELVSRLQGDSGSSSSPAVPGSSTQGAPGVVVTATAQSSGVVFAPAISGCTIHGPVTLGGGVPTGSVAGAVAATADSGMGEGQDLFGKHKSTLETRLGLLGPILSELEHRRIISDQERDEVESQGTKSKQNQALLSMLQRKGGPAQEEFFKILQEKDAFLFKDLTK